MSEANPSDYDDKRKELINEAKETKEQIERKQNEALAEIAKGEGLEQYETVEMGQLEMEVKAWVPGDATNSISQAAELAQSGDIGKIQESMEKFLPALDELTVSNEYSMGFWREYYNRYGPQGMLIAVERVCGPAFEELDEIKGREVDEERIDAANGFRQDSNGEVVRSGRGNDGTDPS
jgi:hypothetical protein